MSYQIKHFTCLLCLCAVIVAGDAQTLGISTEKTTSLVFPYPVKHVDRGTDNILVQPVKGSNILLVKAACKAFCETNLTVFTEDGSIYPFRILYDEYPNVWVYRLPLMTHATMAMHANGILDNPRTLRGIRDRKWNMEVAVTGIYIKEDVMYYQLHVWNNSPINYDVELLRFFVRDRKKIKRTAIQENELTPLYITGRRHSVKAYSNQVVVVALEKLTMPDAKFLTIQIMEKNGGRHLQVKIRNRDLLKARVLAEMH